MNIHANDIRRVHHQIPHKLPRIELQYSPYISDVSFAVCTYSSLYCNNTVLTTYVYIPIYIYSRWSRQYNVEYYTEYHEEYQAIYSFAYLRSIRMVVAMAYC